MQGFGVLSVCLTIALVQYGAAQVSECRGLLDLVVVTDGSDSICAPDFLKLKLIILTFLDDLALGEDRVRFGLVLYSTEVALTIPLSTNREELRTQVATLPHPRNGTRTDLGIQAMSQIFRDYGRAGVPKAGIVITDGLSKHPVDTAIRASMAKANGINMFVVGVGENIERNELGKIASSGNQILSVDSFDQLKTDVQPLMKQVCPQTTSPATPPVTTTMQPTTTVPLPTTSPTKLPATLPSLPLIPIDDDFLEDVFGTELTGDAGKTWLDLDDVRFWDWFETRDKKDSEVEFEDRANGLGFPSGENNKITSRTHSSHESESSDSGSNSLWTMLFGSEESDSSEEVLDHFFDGRGGEIFGDK